jgi:hypothetical protein
MVVESRKRHQMRHLDVLYGLLRDQEVDGSNPFAPTIFKGFLVFSLQFLVSIRANSGHPTFSDLRLIPRRAPRCS